MNWLATPIGVREWLRFAWLATPIGVREWLRFAWLVTLG